MTLAEAQAAANSLRAALLDNGVRKVSIELQQGVAGSGWHVDTFVRGLGHHIVSRPSMGLTPGLALCKRGRGAPNPLTGPLCNAYGGFDLVARIITMGWANHPGAGGPWSVPGWGTVPKDDGRPRIFGWEFEGGLEPWTDEMHDFMARCGAGTLDWLGNAPLECWGEHKTWAPGRKIDRLGYTTESGRARIAAVRGTKEDDVPLTAQDEAQIKQYGGLIEAAAIRAAAHIATATNPWGLDNLRRRLEALSAQVAEADRNDAPELVATAVLDALPEQGSGPEGGLTREDVKQAIREVFGGLDNAA